MRKVYRAYYHENREYESNINKYRVSLNYTQRELAKKIGCNMSTLSNLTNGIDIPYYLAGERKGQIKPYVLKLCEILQVPVDELFPRYICDIERHRVRNSTILPEQAPGLFISTGSFEMSKNTCFSEETEFIQRFRKVIKLIPKKQANILISKYVEEKSLGEIAREYKCSRQMICLIINGCVKKVKVMMYRLYYRPKGEKNDNE